MRDFSFFVEYFGAIVVFIEGVFGGGGALVGDGLGSEVEAEGVLWGVIVLGVEEPLLGDGPVVSGVSRLHFISIYYGKYHLYIVISQKH